MGRSVSKRETKLSKNNASSKLTSKRSGASKWSVAASPSSGARREEKSRASRHGTASATSASKPRWWPIVGGKEVKIHQIEAKDATATKIPHSASKSDDSLSSAAGGKYKSHANDRSSRGSKAASKRPSWKRSATSSRGRSIGGKSKTRVSHERAAAGNVSAGGT